MNLIGVARTKVYYEKWSPPWASRGGESDFIKIIICYKFKKRFKKNNLSRLCIAAPAIHNCYIKWFYIKLEGSSGDMHYCTKHIRN